MNEIFRPNRIENARRGVSLGLALLSLAALIGCQGFSSAKSAATTSITGSGQLAFNAATGSFGTVQVGSSEPESGTITNTGTAAVTVSLATVSGAGFTLSGISAPLTLAAGQSATFTVTFTPQAAGAASGSITIASNASNSSLVLALSGTGTTAAAQLSASPATLAAGDVFVGFSGTASGSLSASGANVTVTAVSSSNSGFAVSGLSLPAIITAGTSVPFTLTFRPRAAGSASATLTFTSNAQPSAITDAATGTGVTPPSHTVNLSWNASSSSNISGYNIYRAPYGTSCGSYSKINGSTLNTGTTYADSSVVDGTNYCYATTAVNSTNEESAFSNVVSDVQIPAP